MDAVTLQFSTSLEWQSALIRRICRSRFSHVDLVLADGRLLGASDPGGVAIRPVDYQPFGIRRQAVVATPLADAIYTAALSQLGKPFDHDALFQFLTGALAPPWLMPDRWFCSELVAWAFESRGFFCYPLAVNLGRITPQELILLLNPYFDVIRFEQRIEGLVLGQGEA